jgi:metabolite-proton symporter
MADSRAPAPTNSMSRVALASLTGTTIEYYDFYIYGTAAALVFPTVFFPALGGAAGTVASFATFGVAFIARPFGAILFGHFGDRIGRKRTLVSTLLLMGLATLAIGLLPASATLGVLAPSVLVLMRLLQGLAVGGEWAGATLLTAENAPAGKRGRYAMFPQLGPSVALALASATFLTTTLTMSDDQFLSWGWRIPFLVSVALIGVGLYIRLNLDETRVFKQATQNNAVADFPVGEAVRNQGREILLVGGALTMLFAFFYIGVSYLTSYGTQQLELSRPTVLALGIAGGLTFAATTIVSAVCSDRLGRRKIIVLGNAFALLWALALFPILDVGTAWAFGVGLCVTLGLVGIVYGPAGAYLPEIFSTRYRYTGAGMAYSAAGVLGGSVPPLLAAALVENFGSYSIGVYLASMALLSLICVLALRETKDLSLSDVPTTAAPQHALVTAQR